MRKQSLFSKERLVYWSDEFADVVNLLTGKDAQGNATHPPVCSLNADAIALAAAVGLKHKRKREFGNGVRKEISTATFAARGWEPYILLAGVLGGAMSNVEILRPDNEELLIKEFEQYAAGGLEFLRTEFSESPTKGSDWVIERLFAEASKDPGNQGIPSLI
jgi:dnd system-associated protein 4